MDETELTTTEPTEETAAPAEGATTPTPSPTPPPAADAKPWQSVLDEVDPKQLAEVLRTHPRVRGIVGTELQRAREEERRQIQEQERIDAERRASEELRALAENSPLEFAERWLNNESRKTYQEQLENLRGSARNQMAEQIGSAVRELPEWAELTPEDNERLMRELVGKRDDEVLPIFQKAAIDLVAEKRARRLFQQWKEKELGRERGVVRQEEAARLFREGPAPRLETPKSAPGGNPANLPDAEFNKWWRERYGR